MRRLSLFLRGAVFDFVLCLVASAALTIAISYGFESAPDLRGSALVACAIAAPMLVILFAGAWSKRAVVISGVGAFLYAACVVGAFSAMSPSSLFEGGMINDVADNYAVYALVALIVPVVVYLLSRRRIGAVILLVASILSFELSQFLFRDWMDEEPAALISFVGIAAVGALFIFQGYRASVYAAHKVDRVEFGTAALFSALTCVVCVGLGALVFYGIIAGLGLSTPDIKPFQDEYTRPTVEYSGVYSEQQVDNPDVTTSSLNDNENDSNQDATDGTSSDAPNDSESLGSNPLSDVVKMLSAFSTMDWDQQFRAINYQQLALSALLVLIPIALLILAAVLLRRRVRERRLERLAGEERAYRIWYLYNFLLGRLERMGVERSPSLTPMEFALSSQGALAPYAQGTGGVDFLDVTLAYQRASIGADEVAQEDYDVVERYYRAFFRNAYLQSGKRRWTWRFWRI